MSTVRAVDVSLYIPARNSARTLAAAIASVQAQTVQPAEFFLVIDARSTDETLALARASGVRVVEQNEGRLGFARNLALTTCRTPWLASCDADVALEPTWLARLLEQCDENIAAISGCTFERLITAADRWRAVNMPHNWGPAAFDNPFMLISEMLARVEALRAVGGYLPDLAYGEDSDLCQRLRQAGYTLRYEPAAVAHHDRADSAESVLDLRWVYSYHRQRPRFESLPGLIEKLRINRTYCIQSLSQTLHSAQADTLALGLVLWFHHAVRDLRAALARWPLVSAPEQTACCAAVWRAAWEQMDGVWGELAGLGRALLPGLVGQLCDIGSGDGGDGLVATIGFQGYVERVGDATRSLSNEIPSDLVPAVLDSARRLAAPADYPRFERPRFLLSAEERRRLAARPRYEAWTWATLEALLQELGGARLDLRSVGASGPTLAGEVPADVDGAARVVLIPHLECAEEPQAQLRRVLQEADWAVVAYQAPESLVLAVPMLSPRDIAATCAQAGFVIRHFYTEAGRTRLVVQRGQMVERVGAAAVCTSCEVGVTRES